MKAKVALVGFGAIAQEVLRGTQHDDSVSIAQVLVRQHRVDEVQVALGPKVQAICHVQDLSPSVEFVLECAGHEAVSQFGADVLSGGTDFGVISVGALADPAVLDTLRRAAARGQSRVAILPGAIGGIDALAAAGEALDYVSYTSRKPPMSWAGSPAEADHDLRDMTEPTTIFSGNAREAALAYPKNANVVATVALAGIGFDRTEVSLVADPKAAGNTHQIRAQGPLFDLSYDTKGAALPSNPKTSALTALSAIRSLRMRTPGIQI